MLSILSINQYSHAEKVSTLSILSDLSVILVRINWNLVFVYWLMLLKTVAVKAVFNCDSLNIDFEGVSKDVPKTKSPTMPVA